MRDNAAGVRAHEGSRWEHWAAGAGVPAAGVPAPVSSAFLVGHGWPTCL